MEKQDRCKFGIQCRYLSQGQCFKWHPREHLILCNRQIFLIGRRESDFKHVEFIYKQFDCIQASPIKSLQQCIINLKVIQDQQSHYYEAQRKQNNKIQIKSQLPDREAVKIIVSQMFKNNQKSPLLYSRSQFSSLGTAYRFFFNTQFNFFILGENRSKIKAENIQEFCLYDGVRVIYTNNPNKKNYITQVHWKDFQQKLSGIVQVKGGQFYFIPRNQKKDKIHLLNTHPVMRIIPELSNYNFFKDQKISKQRQREINKQLVDYLFMVKVIGLSPELGYACWFEDPYFKGINCDNLIKCLKYEYEDKIVFKNNFQQLKEEQLVEFKQYYANELKNRTLVKGFTFSIDSEGTQCYDDAYTIIKQGNLFNVKIHIADVGGLIKQDSNLDNMLKKSKESQYIKNNFVPMLNKEIANIFSLTKDQEKNVLTMQFKVDTQARIDFQNVQFYQSKIIANQNYSHFKCDLRKQESLKNLFELGKVLRMQTENQGEDEETTHATISRLIQLVKDIPAFVQRINYTRLIQKKFSISFLNNPDELFKKLQKLEKKRKFLQGDIIQGKEDDDQAEDDHLNPNFENDENEDDQISTSEDEISYEIKFPIHELKKPQQESKKRIENLFKEFGIEKDLSKKENFKKGFKQIMKKQDNLTFKLYIKRFMNLNKAHFPFIAKYLETLEKKNEKKKIDKNELRQKIMQKIKFYEQIFFTAYFYFLQNKQEQNKKSENNAQNIIKMMQSYLKQTGKIIPLQPEISHLQIEKMVFGDKNEIQNQFKKFLKFNSKSKQFKWNNPIRSYSAIIIQRIICQNKQTLNHILSWDEVLSKEELNKRRQLRSQINKNLHLIQKQVTKQERILYREINNEVDKINLFEKTRLEGMRKINFIRIPQQQYGQAKFWAYHEIFDVQAFDVSPKELDKIPYYHEFPLLIEVDLSKFPDLFNLMVE